MCSSLRVQLFSSFPFIDNYLNNVKRSKSVNRPFPSCCEPHYESEALMCGDQLASHAVVFGESCYPNIIIDCVGGLGPRNICVRVSARFS